MRSALLALLIAASRAAAAPQPLNEPAPGPGVAREGPGSGAALHLSVSPAAARPGDAVLLTVDGAAAEPTGKLAGRPLAFFPSGRAWRAVAALPIETAVGPLPVEIASGEAKAAGTLAIVEPGFPSLALTLPPKFVEPPPEAKRRMADDQKAFEAAFAQAFGPPRFARGFGWPRRSKVTGRFGDQRTLNGKKESVHYGLDLSGKTGQPVSAANDGEVVLARDCYMSGRSVVVAHGAGVYSVYFHLSRIDVHPGQLVRRGQRLGLLGASGRATGPHLHFGLKVAGLYVDPESIFRADVAGWTAPARAAAISASAAGATAVRAGSR